MPVSVRGFRIALAALSLTVGCGPRNASPIGHAAIMSRVELVRKNVPAGEWPQGPERSVPAEMVSTAADGSRTFWVKGHDGKRVRAATGSKDTGGVAWDPTGTRLALLSRTGDLTVVEPPSLRPRRVASVDLAVGPDLIHILWAGNRVVIFGLRPPAKRLLSLEVDVAACATRVLARDQPGEEEFPAVEEATASPDGRYVVYSRDPMTPCTRHGVWLLDLRTGACAKATWEGGSDYHHMPLLWEAPDRFLFVRRVTGQEGWDLYRAYLKTAPAGAARRPRSGWPHRPLRPAAGARPVSTR
jgi:hypothetical protein